MGIENQCQANWRESKGCDVDLDREETRWLGRVGASAGVSGGWAEAPSWFLTLSQGDKLSPGASNIFYIRPQRGGKTSGCNPNKE